MLLEHGGRLNAAAARYRIDRADWLDLSTGINPDGWPVPQLPADVWQRLPEDDDALPIAVEQHYGRPGLPVAGSQAALATLPRLRAACRVGVIGPTYGEHAHAWQRAGHEVRTLTVGAVEAALGQLDVLVAVNPDNPTGRLLASSTLLGWHRRLAARGGWLLVDEAYMDAEPSESLLAVHEGTHARVPTAGAMEGSRKSTSSETCRSPFSALTLSRNSRRGATIPRSSRTRMSQITTSVFRSRACSAGSTERMP